jgi:hypothetical protein
MTTETATHTPGPWHADGFIVRDGGGVLIADACGDSRLPPEVSHSNADLIAAAPGLLAAAEAMYGSLSWLLDQASDAHDKCNLSDDTECREGSPTDHEEIRAAYLLRRVIKATIAQAREGEAS